jgi:hypothetical protein
MKTTGKHILGELKAHAPFTTLGALSGILIIIVILMSRTLADVSDISPKLFFILHPLHIFLSAIVTTALYRLHKSTNIVPAILIGYFGSVGIATLSDSVIPFLGEWILNLPNKGIHIGFIEEPWLTHPAALLGILIAFIRPVTRFPHFGHVLISTWASLFHILMALGTTLNALQICAIFIFLFLAVWIPCCLSDIVFPMLFIHKPIRHDHKTEMRSML